MFLSQFVSSFLFFRPEPHLALSTQLYKTFGCCFHQPVWNAEAFLFTELQELPYLSMHLSASYKKKQLLGECKNTLLNLTESRT